MNMKSFQLWMSKAVFWGFVALLSTPVALLLLGYSDFSPEVENRMPEPFPAVKWGGMHDYPRAFEAYFSDAFGLRSTMIALNSKFQSRILGGTIAPDVLIGREGWLFYKGEHFRGIPQCNLQVYFGTYPLDNEFLKKAAHVQNRLHAYFAERGIQYALVLVPSKISIYPEYMKGGKDAPKESAIDVVAAYLTTHAQAPVINLRPDLLRRKQKTQAYHKTDTHWNDESMLFACRKIAEKTGISSSAHDPWSMILQEPQPYTGDLAKMLGGNAADWEEERNRVSLRNPGATVTSDGPVMDQLRQSVWLKDAQYYVYENPEGNGSRLLCFGDSFFLRDDFHLYFSEAFSFSAFLWSDHLASEFVEAVQPNLVIWEVSERRLKVLAEALDPSLLPNPAKP